MKNWKTTIAGALLAGIAFLSIYQTNGGDLAHWQQWIIPFLLAFFGYVAKDFNVSGKASVFVIACMLTSCSSSPVGEKTFLGITRAGWIATGKAAVISAVPVALSERSKTAAKQPVDVSPE